MFAGIGARGGFPSFRCERTGDGVTEVTPPERVRCARISLSRGRARVRGSGLPSALRGGPHRTTGCGRPTRAACWWAAAVDRVCVHLPDGVEHGVVMGV